MADLIMCFIPLFALISDTTLKALALTAIALVHYCVRNYDVIWAIKYLVEFLP